MKKVKKSVVELASLSGDIPKGVSPLKNKFGVEGMTTPNIQGLINHYVKSANLYVEIGSYQGRTLMSAAHKNNALCIGIDNFSQFDKNGENERILKDAINDFDNIEFIKADCFAGIRELGRKVEETKVLIDVFFYDGNHTYDDTFKALEKILPLLSDNAKMIIDDTNWDVIHLAVTEFCAKFGFEIEFERKTKKNGSKDWWNGIIVISKKEEDAETI